IEVEAVEFLGVVERSAHRIGLGRILVEHPNIQLVWPPVAIRSGRPACRVRDRALARAFVSFCVHVSLRLRSVMFFELFRWNDYDFWKLLATRSSCLPRCRLSGRKPRTGLIGPAAMEFWLSAIRLPAGR